MALTPETLTRHELRGLPVRVAAAASDAHVGLAGVVVSESMRTLTVRTSRGDKQVPKEGTTFRFVLSAQESGDGVGRRHTEPSTGAPRGRESPLDTDESRGRESPLDTDEAAGDRKAPGSAFELPSSARSTLAGARGQYDTTGVTAGQSDGCEDAVSVTVDGARLLSRPAFRTERAGDH
ncbi:ribonuclease P protein subunit [Halobaculum gomorrense]|uniref:Ribonuclease P protein component 1 n=1 Tax=Halobaculum gomorrense TaxID=43928 RepID=A0A1M5L3A0_9EURY|nr:ribonuclease P protein subunit [Halobaculum gomorrense]SHG58893.1 ribonuclease P protein subunit POP4 [Halobaculum gomorrense]